MALVEPTTGSERQSKVSLTMPKCTAKPNWSEQLAELFKEARIEEIEASVVSGVEMTMLMKTVAASTVTLALWEVRKMRACPGGEHSPSAGKGREGGLCLFWKGSLHNLYGTTPAIAAIAEEIPATTVSV